MTIKELRQIIEKLPDEMNIIIKIDLERIELLPKHKTNPTTLSLYGNTNYKAYVLTTLEQEAINNMRGIDD